jgi:Holliday junction resolvase-like predicted endonuclease
MSIKKNNEHIKVGKIGEYLATRFLEERAFKIIERNYRKPWGEIDIIAVSRVTKKTIYENGLKIKSMTNISSIFSKKQTNLHFIEVKSVSHETPFIENINISHETDYAFNPEERMKRVIQSYLLNSKIAEKIDWQFDIISVWLDLESKKSKIKYIENMVL